MSASHLVPTQITDKNGKRTTVRKRPVAASTLKSVPPPVKPASTGTLLKKPRPLTENESWAFVTSLYHPSSPRVMADAEVLEPDTKALIKDLKDREVFDHALIARMVSVLDEEDQSQFNAAMSHNFFLVAENLQRQGRNLTTEQDQFSLVKSLIGSYFIQPPAKRPKLEKITTQEELDKVTALTCATSHWERMANEEIVKPWYPTHPESEKKSLVYTIRDRKLAALIAERPAEVDRIIGYIDARTGKFGVTAAAVREFLDSTVGAEATAEGWL